MSFIIKYYRRLPFSPLMEVPVENIEHVLQWRANWSEGQTYYGDAVLKSKNKTKLLALTAVLFRYGGAVNIPLLQMLYAFSVSESVEHNMAPVTSGWYPIWLKMWLSEVSWEQSLLKGDSHTHPWMDVCMYPGGPKCHHKYIVRKREIFHRHVK